MRGYMGECIHKETTVMTTNTCAASDNEEPCKIRHQAAALNPFVLSYVYIRTKSQNRCDSCTYIYVHGLCDRNRGLLPASKRHFTVSPHEVFP